MNENRLIAGMIDENVEIFAKNGKVYYTKKGAVKHLSELDSDLKILIENEIDRKTVRDIKKEFSIQEEDVFEQFCKCRFGNLNFDADIKEGKLQEEHPNCDRMLTCKLFDKVCKVPPAPGGKFTKMEYIITSYVGKGLCIDEISSILFISTSTIRTHLSRIHRKLNVKTNAEVAAYAAENRM